MPPVVFKPDADLGPRARTVKAIIQKQCAIYSAIDVLDSEMRRLPADRKAERLSIQTEIDDLESSRRELDLDLATFVRGEKRVVPPTKAELAEIQEKSLEVEKLAASGATSRDIVAGVRGLLEIWLA
jgi:hypothetical protein